MKYSYEFKLDAVNLYRQGKGIDTPEWITNEKNFRNMIVRWSHLEEHNGPEVLRHKSKSKRGSKQEKLELISQVLEGSSLKTVAYKAGINHGALSSGISKYKKFGYNGLPGGETKLKFKESSLNKNDSHSHKLKESEYNELIRLRKENEFIKTENAALKKEIALREEKGAARLKAKKQLSSKNSEKKVIN